jgi:O-acetyl-ADP-ribose deacetylase (regulator of RNase III)
VDIAGTTITAIQADLTTLDIDAIVNAANERLEHGGGVALAIARAGGPAVQRESDVWVAQHGQVTTGRAAVTTAGDMPARMVVHVVGPRYRQDQDNEGLLRAAVEAALTAAAEWGIESIALPAISAGVFGYPLEEATAVIASTVKAWATEHRLPSRILLVGYDEKAASAFEAGLAGV